MRSLLLLIAIFTADPAFAQFYNCGITTQTDLGFTTVSTLALAKNKDRKCLIFQNHAAAGSSVVYIKFNSAHTGTEGFVLAGASTTWEPIHVPIGDVYMKSVPGGYSVTIIEGR